MKISKLSLKKVNNIDRQIAFLHGEVINERNGGSYIKAGENTHLVRDFYDFFIDGKSLIHIINKNYWNGEVINESIFLAHERI